MTNEMIHNTAREIVLELLWLTEDEERQVMELVQHMLREKRQHDISQRG